MRSFVLILLASVLALSVPSLSAEESASTEPAKSKQQSQQPAPSPRIDRQPQKPNTAQTNKESQNEQRGTKEKPFVIEIVQPTSGATYTGQKPTDGNSKSPEDKTVEKIIAALSAGSALISAIAAAIMAVFTGLLYFTNKNLWNEARRTSEIAAHSADTAARGFNLSREDHIATHRPKIMVRRMAVRTVPPRDTLEVEFIAVKLVQASLGLLKLALDCGSPILGRQPYQLSKTFT